MEDEFIACALIAMADCDNDETPDEGLDDLAEAAQQLYVGYVAAGIHKGKAKGKGKGKGKPGKGKHVFKTQLTVEQRKKRLADLKSRSRCLRCGLQGHWAGDPICKMTGQKKPQSTAPPPHTDFLATISDSDGSESGSYDELIIGCKGKDADLSAYMAYRTPVSRARGPPSSAGGSLDDSFSMVSESDTRKQGVRRTAGKASSAGSMDSLPPGSETKFTFGQHVGMTFHEVMHKYPGYYLWGKEQKSPSKNLATFLDWATVNYEVDAESHEVLPRTMPVVPRLPRSSHEKTTGGRRKPPNPPLEQCATCVQFTSLGSNAYYQIKTCLDCGHSTRTKRELKPTKDPVTCKHEDIDRRGSSRYTARFFCKLRGATVDEMPQEEAKRRQGLAQALATLPSAAVDTAERVVQDEKQDVCLTIEGAVQMMHLFQADVEAELEGGGPIRATVIYEILTNSIEAVRESAPDACFMALTPMDDTIVGPALPVIDIWNDPGVWAVLDEGCNSTVCGEEWLERAIACYAAVGYDVVKVSDVGKPFKGLSGTCVTRGSLRLPFALTFEAGKEHKLPGVLETHVIPGRIPLLLSQHAQAALNFTKSMADSTVTIAGHKVELCRVKESGLLCINLSRALGWLREKKLPPSLKELRLQTASNPTAFPAMTEATGPDVMIITCGKEFQREIQEFDESQPFRGRHEKARAVQRTLGLTQRLTYLVSVLDMGDPHHDKNLRGHVGCHPHILEGTMATEYSATAMKALINMVVKCKEPVAIVIYCNRNRHRSVAAGWLAASCVGHLSGKTVTLEHRNAKDSWPAMYGSCRGNCQICPQRWMR